MEPAKDIVLICLVLTHTIISVDSSCVDRSSCGECMGDPACVWCADPPPFTGPRCSDLQSGKECGSPMFQDSSFTVTEDTPLNLVSDSQSFVQIQPQAATVTARPGRPVNISFSVGHAKNFPVDLYFLMDLSWSMRSSRDILTTLGGDIISAIEKKTNDVNIGFGSFVEKNVPPFTSSIPEFNCASENPNCAPPYSFYHQQKLADITAEEFSEAVLGAPLAGNVDDPEGSLDALMQVMVCNQRIGWRERSRKIIIVFTDKDFHFALDGKLAGILKPNDGLCHLNDTGNGSGYYTMGEGQDYPSISHINQVAQKSSFIILFAVAEAYRDIYQALVDRIPGSSVDVLSKDGSNMVQIIESKYEEISTSIQMSAGTSGSSSTVTFFSDCGSQGTMMETGDCSNIQIGTSVRFKAQVEVESCTPPVFTIPIYSLGMNESLLLRIEAGCRCACSDVVPDRPSPECRGQGRLVCGECACEAGHYGRTCECDGQNEDVEEDACRETPSSPVCSGRGECSCGVCECAPHPQGTVSGLYCNCEDWTCPKDDQDRLCSGNGDCRCGVCSCYPGWEGEACECSQDKEPCLSPYDGETCSGNGDCICGRCQCKRVESGNALYTGRFCERNQERGSGVCQEVRYCVECQQFPTEDQDQEECDRCVFQSLTKERSEANLDSEDVSLCTFTKNCKYSFTVQLDQEGSVLVYLLTVNGEKEECEEIGVKLGIGAGLLVLLIGVLTICVYKIFIEIRDRRQYARFKRDADLSKYAVNQMPNDIYKSPITKFTNPTFKG